MLLNHDRPACNRYVNSAGELLEFLNQSVRIRGKLDLKVSLCFKNSPSGCGETDASLDWLNLVDGFFNKASELQRDTLSSVEFVLDGGASPARECLEQRWRPWNSTMVTTRDPPEAFSSDDRSKGFDRILALDPPIRDFHRVSQLKFGKFVQSQYPIFVWEPQNEDEITKVSKEYIESKIIHKPGLKFAINIDPIQLELFVAKYTKRAIREKLSSIGKPVHIMSLNTNDLNGFSHVLFFQKEKSLFFHHISKDSSESLLVSTSFDDAQAVVMSVADIVCVLSISHSKMDVFKWNSQNLLSLIGSQTVSIEKVSGHELKSFRVFRITDELLIVSSIALWSETNQICFYSWKFSLGKDTVHSTKPSQQCQTSPKLPSKSIQSLDFSVSHDSQSVYCSSNSSIMASVALTTLDMKNLVGFFCLYGDSREPKAFKEWINLGIGSNVRVSTANGRHLVVGVVLTNSFCWNNERHNKDSYTAVCDQKVKSTPGVLSYAIGPLESWIQHLDGSMITPCSSFGVLRGSFDVGFNPVIHLNLINGTFVQVLEAHEAPPSSFQNNHCGMPSYRDGIVFNGWTMSLSYPLQSEFVNDHRDASSLVTLHWIGCWLMKTSSQGIIMAVCFILGIVACKQLLTHHWNAMKNQSQKCQEEFQQPLME